MRPPEREETALAMSSPLRVCWFTNVPTPSACALLGRRAPVGGSWIAALAAALAATGQVELAVVTGVVGKGGTAKDADGVMHFLLGMTATEFLREVVLEAGPSGRRRYLEVLSTFRPDIVHIHGTEYGYGLLVGRGTISLPAVVSLQGFVGECYRHDRAGISTWTRLRNLGVPNLRSPIALLRGSAIRWAQVRNERQILAGCTVFLGRTSHDEAELRAVNRSACYYHIEEPLRPEFLARDRERLPVTQYSVLAPDSSHPRKGFHCLLAALGLLTKEFPALTVRVPGRCPRRSWRADWYENYVRRLMRRFDLEKRVSFLGQVSAHTMAEELARAHVFAYPSYVDNSPNALAEAMMVGVPIVTSDAGGIPSMVRDGQTALCFPVGDAVALANQLTRLFADRQLASSLAHNAREVARRRHDPKAIADAVLRVYRETLASRR